MTRRITGLLIALLAAAACHSDRMTSPANSPAGTWRLTTVDGGALPVEQGAGYAILSDVITLTADGRFQDVLKERWAERGDTTLYYIGTWLIQDDSLVVGTNRIKDLVGSSWRVIWHADSLIDINPSGRRAIYRRD